MPVRDAAQISVQDALDRGVATGLQGPLKVTVPAEPGAPFTVAEIARDWPVQRDEVALDPYTGAVTEAILWQDFPVLSKLTRIGILAHMGDLFGLFSQLALAATALGLLCMIFWGYRMAAPPDPRRRRGSPHRGVVAPCAPCRSRRRSRSCSSPWSSAGSSPSSASASCCSSSATRSPGRSPGAACNEAQRRGQSRLPPQRHGLPSWQPQRQSGPQSQVGFGASSSVGSLMSPTASSRAAACGAAERRRTLLAVHPVGAEREPPIDDRVGLRPT